MFPNAARSILWAISQNYFYLNIYLNVACKEYSFYFRIFTGSYLTQLINGQKFFSKGAAMLNMG